MLEGVVGAEGQTYTPQPYTVFTKLMCLAVCTAVQAGAKCNDALTNLPFNVYIMFIVDIRKGTLCRYILVEKSACFYAVQINTFYS